MSSDWDESELRDAVHRAAGEVDIGGPSFEGVAAASRRRRTAAVVGTVAAVVVIGTGTAAGVGAFHGGGGGSTAVHTAGAPAIPSTGLTRVPGNRYCPPSRPGLVIWPSVDNAFSAPPDGPNPPTYNYPTFASPSEAGEPAQSPGSTGSAPITQPSADPTFTPPYYTKVDFTADQVYVCVYAGQAVTADSAVLTDPGMIAWLTAEVNQASEQWTMAKNCTDTKYFDEAYLVFTSRHPYAEYVNVDLTPCYGWLEPDNTLIFNQFSQTVEGLVGRTMPEAVASK